MHEGLYVIELAGAGVEKHGRTRIDACSARMWQEGESRRAARLGRTSAAFPRGVSGVVVGVGVDVGGGFDAEVHALHAR